MALCEAYYVSVRGEAIATAGPGPKGPRQFGPVVSVLVFLPLMMVNALISLPFIPLVARWKKRERRLLIDAMKAKNRVMQWPEFVQALEEKRGTLIVDGDPMKGPNFWWTREDVRSVSPVPCSCDLGSLFDRAFEPFRAWCFQRYTNPTTGSALLVLGGEGERRGFAIGGEEDEIGTGIFKDMPTVLTLSRHR